MLLTGARHHPTRPHSSSRLDCLHRTRTASVLAVVAARLRLLSAENERVNLSAAVSLLQLYQDGRSEHIRSGMSYFHLPTCTIYLSRAQSEDSGNG